MHDSLQAAEHLKGEIDVEVLDLRSVVPWDGQAMLESAGRTHRTIVVHQAVQRFGVGAEIAAWLSQELFGTLAAPILGVGGEYTAFIGQLESLRREERAALGSHAAVLVDLNIERDQNEIPINAS